MHLDRKGKLVGEKRRDRVSNLSELLLLGAMKLKPVREALKSGCLADGQASTPSIGQTDSLHVACRAGEIPTGQGSGRLVQLEIAGAAAVRCFLVGGNVAVHRGGQELRVGGNGVKKPVKRFAGGGYLVGGLGE